MSLPPKYNLLAKHPNPVYIETGIYRGDSIQLAFEAGFPRVIGIEIFQDHINFCYSRFFMHKYDSKLKLHLGDSAFELWDVIKDIKEPMTIFLDSHSQLLEDEEPIANPFPLLKELKQIAQHPVKTSTIIIDDILILTHPDVTGWTKQLIEDHIYAINPDYKIEYLANPVKNNLLIAKV